MLNTIISISDVILEQPSHSQAASKLHAAAIAVQLSQEPENKKSKNVRRQKECIDWTDPYCLPKCIVIGCGCSGLLLLLVFCIIAIVAVVTNQPEPEKYAGTGFAIMFFCVGISLCGHCMMSLRREHCEKSRERARLAREGNNGERATILGNIFQKRTQPSHWDPDWVKRDLQKNEKTRLKDTRKNQTSIDQV